MQEIEGNRCDLQKSVQIRQPSIKELGHFSLEVVANNYRSGCKWIRIYRSRCKWIKIQAILFMVARSIPKNYRNVTGRFASAKNQNLIGFESTLEKDFFLLLEFDRRVESFEEQPVTIAYRGLEGRVCHYTPDALVRYQAALAGEPDWQPVLYEVKYRSDLREHGVEYRPKFKAARHYARDRGWRFRVVTEREIRTSRLSNIRFLLRYRRMRVDDQDRDALLATLRKQGPLKPPTLLALTYPDSCRYAETLAALWHLVAIGQIGVDLDQLLTPHSVLRLGTAGVDQDSRHLITPVLEPSREKGDDHR